MLAIFSLDSTDLALRLSRTVEAGSLLFTGFSMA